MAEKGASKMDGVVKLVIIFFVCLLSFSIGTFVGKKFSDNQHKVAEFEPAAAGDHQERDVASVQPDSHEVKPSDALSDDEVAKLAEEFVSEDNKSEEAHGSGGGEHEATPLTDKNSEVREAKADAHGTGAHGEKNDQKEKSADHGQKAAATNAHGAQPMKAAAAVAHNENPEKIEKPVVATNRLPSSLPKELADSKSTQYTVQVASFPTAQEAQKLVNEMKAKNLKTAFYVAAKVKDRKTASEKTWYRVHAGLFKTQQEADVYKKDILKNSKVSSAIVTKFND